MIWDQPFPQQSLRDALRHRAVDRNKDKWLVLAKYDFGPLRVVEGHPEWYRAMGARQILEDHAQHNGLAEVEYSVCSLPAKLIQDLEGGRYERE